jgi:hypothetical protein
LLQTQAKRLTAERLHSSSKAETRQDLCHARRPGALHKQGPHNYTRVNNGIGSSDRFRNALRVAEITQENFKVRMRPNAEQGVSTVGESIVNAGMMNCR